MPVSISMGQVAPSLILSQRGHGLNSKGRKGGDSDKEGEELYPMFLSPQCMCGCMEGTGSAYFFCWTSTIFPRYYSPKNWPTQPQEKIIR